MDVIFQFHLKAGRPIGRILFALVFLTFLVLGPLPPLALAQPKPASSLVVKPEVYFGVGPLYSISIAPDGKIIAISGSARKALTIADITVPKILKVMDKEKKGIFCVAFAPDGKTLATSGAVPRIWEAGTWKVLKNLEQFSEATGRLAYSPDGKFLATLETNRTVVLRDLSGAKEPVLFNMQKGTQFHCLAFSPDGKTLAAGDGFGYIEFRDLAAPVPFKDLGRQKPCLTIESGGNDLRFLGFAGNGKLLVTGSYEKLVQIWDAETGKLKRTLKLKGFYVVGPCMAVSPDGKTLAIGGSGDYIDLYDVDTGQAWASLGPHQSWVNRIAFSRDGSTLVSGAGEYAYVFKVPKKK